MWEIIEELPVWMKWTGGSLGVILIFLTILYLAGGEQVVKLPSTVNEIRNNATEQVQEITINATSQSTEMIQSKFEEVGEELAKDVDDPNSKRAIKSSMKMMGLGLSLLIIISVLSIFIKKK